MDDELCQQGASLVGEPAMPVYQLVEIFELADGEVTGQSCLDTLFAVYTYTYVG